MLGVAPPPCHWPPITTAGTAVALAGALDRVIAPWRSILPHAVDFPAAPTAEIDTPDAAVRRDALRLFELESTARQANARRHGGPRCTTSGAIAAFSFAASLADLFPLSVECWPYPLVSSPFGTESAGEINSTLLRTN